MVQLAREDDLLPPSLPISFSHFVFLFICCACSFILSISSAIRIDYVFSYRVAGINLNSLSRIHLDFGGSSSERLGSKWFKPT